ncbi:restriction endonuclease subunit S [Porticoccus sp. W117]|uniref:restriction endonuclease subunit S n=1 Tax=Porticoccus sp. W117 TaxID=3054777 RepID=UPI002597E04A|nr:restriction endonuclease subunit S [Porticoccus sp. W117]MDM3871378.1 restriction endonuclease subunit S [Porticoccus sp. W117]
MTQAEQLITDNLDVWTSAVQTKSTAGRGKSKKLELYGIKKLRELILELAVRGLLVPQDPNDEPASELLKKIAAEKAQLVKEGKIKKQKALPVIEEDEKPSDLPDIWEAVRLGEVNHWAIGSGFPKKEQGLENEAILFSKVSDMNLPGNEKFLQTTTNTVSEETATKLKLKVHPPGTVFFPKIGGAISTNKRRIIVKPTAIDNNCLGLTPTSGITTEYLYLYMLSVDLADYQAGTSVPALSQAVLSNIVFGLPPLAEQTRIVAKVNELMTLCDQLEQQQETSITAHQTLVKTLLDALTTASERDGFTAAWARIADHFDTLFTTEWSIDQLKQTILQLAVMGKLAPQDPNDEPASELLKKIAAEKAQLVKDGKIKKQKPLPPIEENEKPFELSDGWEWARLNEMVSQLGDGLHGTPQYDDRGEYFFVNGNNLRDGEIVIKPETKRVNEQEFQKYRKNLTDRTVLVSINGTLGNVGFYDNELVVLGKSACYFNLGAGASKRFIKILIESPYYLSYAFENATGSTIKNLGLKAMNNFPVALPPKKEQNRIIAKVDQLMALCGQLKAKLNTAQTTQLQLADAIAEQAIS